MRVFRQGRYSKIYRTLKGVLGGRTTLSGIEYADLDWRPLTDADLNKRVKYVIYNETDKNYVNSRENGFTFLRYAKQYEDSSQAVQAIDQVKRNARYWGNKQLIVKKIETSVNVVEWNGE